MPTFSDTVNTVGEPYWCTLCKRFHITGCTSTEVVFKAEGTL